MAWDFSTDPVFQKQLDWVDQFCREEIEPLAILFPAAARSKDPKLKALVDPLKQEVKDRGLWGLFLEKDLGGPGYGNVELALLNEILGVYPIAPTIFGTQGPDTGNMEILAAYGTEEQKRRWFDPLYNHEMFSAFSMTEPGGGSDPDMFITRAERDGEEWVINGEKWFSSAAYAADLLFVMCANGIFIVPTSTPGVEFQPYPKHHNHIIYNNVRVPLDHLLGPEGSGKALAQRRLSGGRIHHAMRTISQCKLAFDMMCERSVSRRSFGKLISEHQSVSNAIAESYAEIEMLRLLVLQTAWLIDQSDTAHVRTQIAACKFTCSKVLRDVSYRAVHIFGALGVTDLTPLQEIYAQAPWQGVMDGADELHKTTVSRRVTREYAPHEGYWPRNYLPAKLTAAREKFRDALEDPQLAALATDHSHFEGL